MITLYFSSDRLLVGYEDIYASTLQEDETFGPAVLVEELNDPDPKIRDVRPSIWRDGLMMFLDSNRLGTLGGQDLFFSTRGSTSEPWSTPVSLGPVVNSTVLDARPVLSFDGTELYFHSNRGDTLAGNDIYVSTRTRFHRKYQNSGNASLRFKVELRPGVVSYVEAIYMANLNRPSGGKTLLAIPGMGLSANSYRPLIEQLFAVEDQSHSKVFSRAVLVDYPGHGGSSLPENSSSADPLLFGDMTLEDYVATILGVMDQLEFPGN